MTYDLVIRNGRVVDGTGLAAYSADVGVAGGRIAAIGRIRERGREEIDAEGHVVTPGFIDGHTHMDAQLFWDRHGSCSCYHGITTAIMGHCGFTLAPSRPDERGLVVRNLERAEDISAAAMAQGINWSWTSFAQFLDAVDGADKSINYAANIGHSALRTWAMGERAFEGPSTPDDMALMQGELRDALRAGAIGFSTSRSEAHETSDNRPVASRLADWDEVRALVGVLGDAGAGVFQLAGESVGTDPALRDDYFRRLAALTIDTGVPIAIPVIGGQDSPDQMDLLDASSAAGGRMFGLCHSRGISVLLSFRTRLPFDALPVWRELRALPLDEQLARLGDPALRRRLVEAAHQGEYGRAIGAEARKPDYDLIEVLNQPVPPNPSVVQMARQRGMDPVELMLELSVASRFEQFFMQPLRYFDPDMLLRVMKHPRTVMTFSDAGAHVSQIMDSSIQTHLLAYWVRQRQAFTLEEAVRMLTLAPARAWGLADRGLLQVGLAADLNVFDPARVAPDMPQLVNDLPGGGRRLMQTATGFLATVVGGEITLRNGQPTGRLSGRLLRGPLYSR